ncbi:MAG: SpoIID/LytB domain-containing protein [Firmicutes bacterium]|nr:SpoIID/LytB domain-containing protein [Bacillota bacterium]
MRRWLCIVLVLVLIGSLGGCRLFRRPVPPAPEPPDGEQKVEIPEEIFQGENTEPELRVYIAEQGQTVTMMFEEYIQGVVAAEMDTDWPVEALAAQAIKARTFTLQKIAEQGTLPNRDAHASSDIQEFQAYNAERINDNVREAVEKTRGLVSVYQGEFVRAWFSAYCGGSTATPEVGLNFQGDPPPYLQPVDCPCYETIDEDEREWTESFSRSQIRNAVRQITGDDPGNFDTVTIASEENGRAHMLEIGGVEVSAPELRLTLDSTEMRSTWYTDINVAGDNVTFSGRGYGHGVGLCQWGARGFAEDNRNAEEIVQLYFPNTSVQQLWE